MMAWVVVIAVGAGSFLFRLGPLLVLRRTVLSETADRAIRHAGQAALSALIALSTRQAAHGQALLPALLAVGVGLVLVVQRATMLRIVLVGSGLYAATVVVAGGLGG